MVTFIVYCELLFLYILINTTFIFSWPLLFLGLVASSFLFLLCYVYMAKAYQKPATNKRRPRKKGKQMVFHIFTEKIGFARKRTGMLYFLCDYPRIFINVGFFLNKKLPIFCQLNSNKNHFYCIPKVFFKTFALNNCCRTLLTFRSGLVQALESIRLTVLAFIKLFIELFSHEISGQFPQTPFEPQLAVVN